MSQNASLILALPLVCLATGSMCSTARADVASLSELPSLLAEVGSHRLARTEHAATPEHPGWTLTAAAGARDTWFCIESTVAEARCYTASARARDFTLPSDPRHAFPVTLTIDLEVAPGDFSELVVRFERPDGEPRLAFENLTGGGAPAAMPQVERMPSPVALLPRLSGYEIIHPAGEITYAAFGGEVVACEAEGGATRCTSPVRVASASDRVDIEADGQGPDIYELEIRRSFDATPFHLELEHVMIFRRDRQGAFGHAGTLPYGGMKQSDAPTSTGGLERFELMFDDLEAAGDGCVFIGRAQPDHRVRRADGTDQRLARPRLARVGATLPELPMSVDAWQLDSSGYWEVDGGGSLRRVPRCSRPSIAQ